MAGGLSRVWQEGALASRSRRGSFSGAASVAQIFERRQSRELVLGHVYHGMIGIVAIAGHGRRGSGGSGGSGGCDGRACSGCVRPCRGGGCGVG